MTVKNLPDVLAAIRNAKAPERFTQTFLEQLGFKSTNDRLYVGVLKALKLLDETGKPTPRYFEFLDQTQSGRVLAEAIREAYSDLFAINVNAQGLSKQEFIGKVRTLSQGQMSDIVLERMWSTYSALLKEADFSAPTGTPDPKTIRVDEQVSVDNNESENLAKEALKRQAIPLGGLVYNIEIHLPESRDKAVYDVLFRSLREHLL